MTWLISDANILIDMEVGGLLDKMFRLSESFAVPDVLYIEELETHHPHLPGLGLQVLEIKEEFVLEAYRLGDAYQKPSYNDLLALSLAKQEQCPLLTGDEQLRLAAEQEQVMVKGTLWVVGRLFSERIIDFEEAQLAYNQMKDEGRRLPWDLINKQLKTMSKD
jgi:predicted nucleic acid-binding protein